jgi:hypothetical protein
MTTKQILVNKHEKQVRHELIDQLFERCYIDALTGKFHCKLCHNVVHIDLSKKLVYCSIHGMLI